MRISTVELQQFRNYQKQTLVLHPKLTLFVGKNGSGKTNILEAIRYVTSIQSFRVKRDLDLLLWDADYARIEGVFERDEKEHRQFCYLERQKLRNGKERVRKTFSLRGKKVKPVEYVGKASSVIFAPQEMQLLTDSPGSRRRYLDLLISQIDPMYYHHLVSYQKVMKQRNALLDLISKNLSSDQELSVWNDQLILHGSYIISQRENYFDFLNSVITDYYSEMSGGDDVVVSKYLPYVAVSDFASELETQYQKETRVGYTTVGPHRDDFEIRYNEKNIVDCGSRGEFRSALLSLKKAEAEFIRQKTGMLPILLLDDVFSELDSERRALLIDFASMMQTVITTTDLDVIDQDFLKDSHIYDVAVGKAVLRSA